MADSQTYMQIRFWGLLGNGSLGKTPRYWFGNVSGEMLGARVNSKILGPQIKKSLIKLKWYGNIIIPSIASSQIEKEPVWKVTNHSDFYNFLKILIMPATYAKTTSHKGKKDNNRKKSNRNWR